MTDSRKPGHSEEPQRWAEGPEPGKPDYRPRVGVDFEIAATASNPIAAALATAAPNAEEEEADRLLQQANAVLVGFDERPAEVNHQLDRALAKLGA